MTHETLIKVILGIRRGYTFYSFSGWVGMLAKFSVLEWAQKLQIDQAKNWRDPQTVRGHVHHIEARSIKDTDARDPGVEDRMVARIMGDFALQQMTPIESAAVMSIYVEGKTAPEYAAEIRVPKSSVEGRLRRAKARVLRKFNAAVSICSMESNA